jgi:hypothetical protein
MCKENTIQRSVYQWQTAAGGVAQELLSQRDAEVWLAKKLLAEKHKEFYLRLALVKIETTIVQQIARPAINPN